LRAANRDYQNPTSEHYDVGFRVCHAPIPGDADRDGDVDLEDLFIVRNNYGGPGGWSEGDFSGDGFVGLADLFDVRNNFTGSLTPIPEPAALSLLALGALAVIRRRK